MHLFKRFSAATVVLVAIIVGVPSIAAAWEFRAEATAECVEGGIRVTVKVFNDDHRTMDFDIDVEGESDSSDPIASGEMGSATVLLSGRSSLDAIVYGQLFWSDGSESSSHPFERAVSANCYTAPTTTTTTTSTTAPPVTTSTSIPPVSTSVAPPTSVPADIGTPAVQVKDEPEVPVTSLALTGNDRIVDLTTGGLIMLIGGIVFTWATWPRKSERDQRP